MGGKILDKATRLTTSLLRILLDRGKMMMMTIIIIVVILIIVIELKLFPILIIKHQAIKTYGVEV
jgi:hypothetical protein